MEGTNDFKNDCLVGQEIYLNVRCKHCQKSHLKGNGLPTPVHRKSWFMGKMVLHVALFEGTHKNIIFFVRIFVHSIIDMYIFIFLLSFFCTILKCLMKCIHIYFLFWSCNACNVKQQFANSNVLNCRSC